MHTCTVPEASSDRTAELARLRLLARKVALVHGNGHPHMTELVVVVSRIADAPATPISETDRTRIATLTNGYVPWAEACGSVRALFAGLSTI